MHTDVKEKSGMHLNVVLSRWFSVPVREEKKKKHELIVCYTGQLQGILKLVNDISNLYDILVVGFSNLSTGRQLIINQQKQLTPFSPFPWKWHQSLLMTNIFLRSPAVPLIDVSQLSLNLKLCMDQITAN